MAEYLLAHDLGTSANKAVLYGLDGRLHGSIVSAYPTVYPQDRWVEQRADDWWKAVCQSTYLLLEQTGVDASDIAAVSFSGQMMGCLLVDRDGNPLRNMIIWADTRSNLQEKRMIEAVGMDVGYQITGHRLSASYSAAKLLWVRDNEPEIYRHTYKMLHAKDYIIFRMTGEFASEYSDASSTNLFDIQKKRWSNELIKDFGIRPSILPDLYPSTYPMAAETTRMGRSGMIDTLGEDYITATYAKGIKPFVVNWKYAFKNAVCPVITLIGIKLGTYLGGTIVVESIFSWPGIGQLLVTAIGQRDYALVQSLLLVNAAMFAIVNLIVDIINSFVDPRISL